MKFLLKLFFFFVLMVAASVVGVWLYRDDLALRWIPKIGRQRLGVELRVKSVTSRPEIVAADLKGVWLGQPAGFPQDQPMLLANRVYADLAGLPIFGAPVVFESVLVDIDRILVVRDSSGRINWKYLRGAGKDAETGRADSGDGRDPIRFDRIDLSIREIRWVDNKRKADITVPLHLEHLILTNVTDEDVALRVAAELAKRARNQVLQGILANEILAVPDPMLRGTGKVVESMKKIGSRLKEKLGL